MLTLKIPAEAAGDEVVPVLRESAADDMVLPDRAVLNDDGSVTLALEYPFDLVFRVPGGEEKRSERFAELVLHRMSGVDMRRVFAVKKNRARMMLARSARLTPGKIELVFGRMDAADMTAASNVAGALMGASTETGLPDHAAMQEDGSIRLPVRFGSHDETQVAPDELVFQRLRGADLMAISQADDPLARALALSTRMTPKDADGLYNAMDAADIMAVSRVVDFLSGNGQRTGR